MKKIIITLCGLLGFSTIGFAYENDYEPNKSNHTAYFEFRDYPHNDKFIVKLTKPAQIIRARTILKCYNKFSTTKCNKKIPKHHIMGTVKRRLEIYQAPYLDPDLDPEKHPYGQIEFFEVAGQWCDGSVEEFKENKNGQFNDGDQWCPWTSELVKEVYPHHKRS